MSDTEKQKTSGISTLYRLLAWGVGLLLLGIGLVVIGFVLIPQWGLRLMLFILAAVILTIGGLLCYSAGGTLLIHRRKQENRGNGADAHSYRQGDRHNYFLFDMKNRVDLTPEQLTVGIVSSKVQFYMNMYLKHGHLDIAFLLEEGTRSPILPAFRPLMIYQLLYRLGSDNQKELWESFLACGNPMVDAMSRVLPEDEDGVIRRLRRAVAEYDEGKGSFETFRADILSRHEWLGEKMLSYTLEHLHEFD